MNAVEQILANHCGINTVYPGDIIEVEPDFIMVNDACGPLAMDILENELACNQIIHPEKTVLVLDHYTPSSSVEAADKHNRMRAFAHKHNISNLYDAEGICHQMMMENHVLPGQLIIGADSHTCTYGACGNLSTGMGSTDIAVAWRNGKTWMKVPETIGVEVTGTWPAGVVAKDLALFIIGSLGTERATYKAVHFYGEAIKRLNMPGRITLCNMAIEAGAKFSYIEPDKITDSWLSEYDRKKVYYPQHNNQSFAETHTFNVTNLAPQVACPHSVDNVHGVSAVAGQTINEIFLGGCTNGNYEDLEIAAKILTGKNISPNTRMLVTPASRRIYQQALTAGIISIFMECGAIVNHPGCSACFGGSGGILGKNEKLLSSANRNFRARVGSAESEIYLASPTTLAASAITGVITDPRSYL